MRFLRIALVMCSLFSALLFVPSSVMAASTLFDNACQADGGAGGQSAACNATPETIQGQNGILAKATKIIAVIAGVAATIMIIISGIYFVTAAGDPSKVTNARNTLIGALVGVVVVLVAQGILTFVLKKV